MHPKYSLIKAVVAGDIPCAEYWVHVPTTGSLFWVVAVDSTELPASRNCMTWDGNGPPDVVAIETSSNSTVLRKSVEGALPPKYNLI